LQASLAGLSAVLKEPLQLLPSSSPNFAYEVHVPDWLIGDLAFQTLIIHWGQIWCQPFGVTVVFRPLSQVKQKPKRKPFARKT
jgi:hypothetical protein